MQMPKGYGSSTIINHVAKHWINRDVNEHLVLRITKHGPQYSKVGRAKLHNITEAAGERLACMWEEQEKYDKDSLYVQAWYLEHPEERV